MSSGFVHYFLSFPAHRRTQKCHTGRNITSLAEVIMLQMNEQLGLQFQSMFRFSKRWSWRGSPWRHKRRRQRASRVLTSRSHKLDMTATDNDLLRFSDALRVISWSLARKLPVYAVRVSQLQRLRCLTSISEHQTSSGKITRRGLSKRVATNAAM